jgi:hypothetical protein
VATSRYELPVLPPTDLPEAVFTTDMCNKKPRPRQSGSTDT